MWNPDAGQPPERLVQVIQESKVLIRTSSALVAQEAGVALDGEKDADFSNWDANDLEPMADFEETRAPGGPWLEMASTSGNLVERTPQTPPLKKTRVSEPCLGQRLDAPLSQVPTA